MFLSKLNYWGCFRKSVDTCKVVSGTIPFYLCAILFQFERHQKKYNSHKFEIKNSNLTDLKHPNSYFDIFEKYSCFRSLAIIWNYVWANNENPMMKKMRPGCSSNIGIEQCIPLLWICIIFTLRLSSHNMGFILSNCPL